MLKTILDNVIIERIKEESDSCIIMKAGVQNKGVIVAVGEGLPDVPMDVKVGDKVLFPAFCGTDINYDGKDYLIMKQHDLLATF